MYTSYIYIIKRKNHEIVWQNVRLLFTNLDKSFIFNEDRFINTGTIKKKKNADNLISETSRITANSKWTSSLYYYLLLALSGIWIINETTKTRSAVARGSPRVPADDTSRIEIKRARRRWSDTAPE